MEKYITDERTGLKYELVGDYYLLAGDNEPEEEQKPIGMWGQRHLRYLKNHRNSYREDTQVKRSKEIQNYLSDIDRQAEEMYERLTRQMAASEDITEQMKAIDQTEWVRKMNNIRNRVTEIVNNDLTYAY